MRKNDKFIKHIEVDENYLTFLKHRYMNHQEIAEEEEPSLPRQWRRKKINGVDYFRDPTGNNVFNSRRLVVEFLRKTRYSLNDGELVGILEESGEESDLSDTDDEMEKEEEESELLKEDEAEDGEEMVEEDSGLVSRKKQTFVEC